LFSGQSKYRIDKSWTGKCLKGTSVYIFDSSRSKKRRKEEKNSFQGADNNNNNNDIISY
jgi:hypothetical protein